MKKEHLKMRGDSSYPVYLRWLKNTVIWDGFLGKKKIADTVLEIKSLANLYIDLNELVKVEKIALTEDRT